MTTKPKRSIPKRKANNRARPFGILASEIRWVNYNRRPSESGYQIPMLCDNRAINGHAADDSDREDGHKMRRSFEEVAILGVCDLIKADRWSIYFCQIVSYSKLLNFQRRCFQLDLVSHYNPRHHCTFQLICFVCSLFFLEKRPSVSRFRPPARVLQCYKSLG